LRSRLVALVLSALLLLLVAAVLLTLGLAGGGKGRDAGHLVAMDMQSPEKGQQAKAAKAQAVQKTATAAPTEAKVQPETPPDPVPVPVPTASYIKLSREEFAASDIAAIGRRRAAESSAQAGASGSAGPTTSSTGGGPGGARLYNAQWYREPRDAELRPFLERGAPSGAWAIIACQTVEHYHVENCQEMEEYPQGSGLARGLRRASWQFLVWPPRIDGKPQVGTWVRIRFDFTKEG
jgi:hypothetical protein